MKELSITRVVAVTIVASLLTGCYFQVGGRDVHLKPDELWREARDACVRRDPRAQRYLLTRIVERYPSSEYATPAQRYLDDLPVCRHDGPAAGTPAPYSQNIGPGASDSTQNADAGTKK